jgi:plastocyanin
MYQWWVFVHLAGVFAFLAAHGVSMGVSFRLRKERDPGKVNDLLQFSASATQVFYVSLGVLVVGGIVAGFLGHWWGQGWIWGAIIVLVLATVAMMGMASPYYRRVRTISLAMAGGSTAVTPEQFDEVLRSGRSPAIAGIGIVALGLILYLMLFKPTFGFGAATSSSAPPPGSVRVVAKAFAFDPTTLHASAGKAFVIDFDNEDAGVPHNVSVYRDASASAALFTGELVTGPKTVQYHVGSLAAGTYFFRCDVHASQMKGTVVVGGGSG